MLVHKILELLDVFLQELAEYAESSEQTKNKTAVTVNKNSFSCLLILQTVECSDFATKGLQSSHCISLTETLKAAHVFFWDDSDGDLD